MEVIELNWLMQGGRDDNMYAIDEDKDKKKSEWLPERACDEALAQKGQELLSERYEVVDGLARKYLLEICPSAQDLILPHVVLDRDHIVHVVTHIFEESLLFDSLFEALECDVIGIALARRGDEADDVQVVGGIWRVNFGEDGIYDNLEHLL